MGPSLPRRALRTSVVCVSGSSDAERAISLLRRVGAAEGVSYLLLLGVAMPLKYLMGYPQAVKVVGWAHGVLFIGFLAALLRARWRAGLGVTLVGWAFVASLLPFGPFLVDGKLAAHSARR